MTEDQYKEHKERKKGQDQTRRLKNLELRRALGRLQFQLRDPQEVERKNAAKQRYDERNRPFIALGNKISYRKRLVEENRITKEDCDEECNQLIEAHRGIIPDDKLNNLKRRLDGPTRSYTRFNKS